ncbi:tRNA (adenosine(37)-N6)-threonylcarbamoyltransferase complex ATPase subunit type 1 TsaE [Rhodoplanes sp. TEM]|uniref:tRNA threonylcarbamoyladenosine biosynthesis protein TsaE n=1 Tax=Rhodoplanes tepidamans TaxID=200616 RepID=A0ABT5J9Z6_RHOTP|nr:MULTISPECIES: tRNA (adenosine(37)-N6)-threonylcarbamoyltransferase complex ATPase subunit type 1 TsaE [Rhodoplanes]MDC7786508.1 tRNA (adenosine(37)-N6)-threonylcarbamoyltransferase complex ATPase subunit type 1 TsaE [Rhodoplanes tepidamans]MDC7983154.1 tRNA (adenosine(37)-N6)-threonylcarbamoyltransferase complex ATPase subunit type 1 TsaE [Rhodoplanes sp. TEM]MDQ0357612.1 tRNA threonylcarbamoyl adenosine modification protein YjeE [Rhodoplanes tepidamans]
MEPVRSGGTPITLTLADEQATRRLAVDLAATLDPGDVVMLSGDLGAGKTTLARALIRHLANDPTLDVPSPTFTLVQSYDLPRFTLMHADFYRLQGEDELAELGLDEIPAGAVVLIEWPDRAPGLAAPERLAIDLRLAPEEGPDARIVHLTGHGSFATRIQRMLHLRRFLEKAGVAEARRERVTGDASSRSYERVLLADRTILLMNAPRRPDGPPVRHGRSYSAIAHLAEDVRAFVAVADALRTLGFSAPEIYGADLAEGFVLLEDLGDGRVVEGDPPTPIAERYRAAVDLLVALHGHMLLPSELPVTPQLTWRLPDYDLDAFLIEIELLLDWYLPRLAAVPSTPARSAFLSFWRDALKPVLAQPPTWVLRDFHSPNLIWLPERRGIERVGVIDFQDAVMGPAAYDLASLLQDARVTVPEELEIELLGRYAKARRANEPAFDVGQFAQIYATVAAQRATKILGIFARLEKRDGKPQYLRHMPRVMTYLQRALAHPSLAPLRAWYAAYVPPPPAGPG